MAIALIRRGNDILVCPVPDDLKPASGWRPAGGTIEFGERGSDAVVREIREELGVDVIDPSYLGTVESIFTYLGETGHELVRVYSVRFADPRLYEQDRFECVEANGMPFICTWKPIADFRGGVPLYPDGLLGLIERDRDGDAGLS